MKQALRAAPAKPVHYERRWPEETTLYHVVQENLETFLAEVEAAGAASLPQFVKDEFDAFLECGILAHGFLRVRCAGCGHEKLQTLLGKIITRILRLLTRQGHLVEEEGVTYVADAHGIVDPDNLLTPLQAAPVLRMRAFAALTALAGKSSKRRRPANCVSFRVVASSALLPLQRAVQSNQTPRGRSNISPA